MEVSLSLFRPEGRLIWTPHRQAAGVRCAESSAGRVPAPDATDGICWRQAAARHRAPADYIVATYRRRHVGGEARRVVACARVRTDSPGDYRLRSTDAGFWPSAVKVPTSPSSTVAAMAPAAAASKGPGSQTKDRFMALVMIKAAAAEPAATPNSAVATPSARYSSA